MGANALVNDPKEASMNGCLMQREWDAQLDGAKREGIMLLTPDPKIGNPTCL